MSIIHPFTTAQGTEILLQPLDGIRSCSLGFWIRSGSCQENSGEAGMAHFLEHAVFKGTRRFPSPLALAEATDQIGGHLDAFTGKEVACFYGKVLSEQLPELVQLLGELISQPLFPEEELQRERAVILEEIAQSEDVPEDWVSEGFYAGFWEGNPLSHSVLGTRESIQGLEFHDLRAFHSRHYSAQSLLIAGAGQVEPESLLRLLEPILESLPRATPIPELSPTTPKPFFRFERRPGLKQTNLLLGFPAPTHRSPDRVAAHLLAHILGGGMSSRLFMELRERRGLCYSISSYSVNYAHSGALLISASCQPSKARELVRRALGECRRLLDDGIQAEELERAILQAKTALVFSLESPTSRMFSLAQQAIHEGRCQSLDEQLQEIESTQADHILEVARQLLRPGTVGISLLGPSTRNPLQASDLDF